RVTLMAEPAAALVARRLAVSFLQGLVGRLGRCRLAGQPPPALGEPYAVGAILDQTQHLEAQALRRRQGQQGGFGDGAQDFVLLGAEWDRMLPFHTDHLDAVEKTPAQRGRVGRAETTSRSSGSRDPAGAERMDLSPRQRRLRLEVAAGDAKPDGPCFCFPFPAQGRISLGKAPFSPSPPRPWAAPASRPFLPPWGLRA